MAFLGIPRDRLPIALGLVAALAATASWLQGRFDTADVEKGISVALAHRPLPGGPSLFEALEAKGEGGPRCGGEIVSAFFGDVRVSCATPARPEVRYDFRVLLDGKRRPKAESDPARALLGDLAAAPVQSAVPAAPAAAGDRTGHFHPR